MKKKIGTQIDTLHSRILTVCLFYLYSHELRVKLSKGKGIFSIVRKKYEIFWKPIF